MVDPLNPRELYRQLADDLERRITAGEWAPGTALPSEADLADAYGVARSTVRLALGVLREAGLIITAPRRATYVRP